MVLGKAPPHHVRHTQGFHPQQVEDHGVGESELGMQDGRFPLRNKEMESNEEMQVQQSRQILDFFSGFFSP